MALARAKRDQAAIDLERTGLRILHRHIDIHASAVEHPAHQRRDLSFEKLALTRNPDMQIQKAMIHGLNFGRNRS